MPSCLILIAGACSSLCRQDGTWAGYMEVVAASRCLGANLTIYQVGRGGGGGNEGGFSVTAVGGGGGGRVS